MSSIDTAESSDKEDEEYVYEEEESESKGSTSSGSSSSSSSSSSLSSSSSGSLSGQSSFSYKQKKEEAADEEEEDEPEVEWIFKRISALETEQISCYWEGNTDFNELITSIYKIRKGHVKLSDVVEPISELLQTENMKTVFTHLQGIYEFIIHMHNRYGVRLNANTSMVKDRVLVDMMQTAFRKYTNFFSLHLLNHFTHIHFSVYFSVVRKEFVTRQLLDDNKFQQVVTFLKELGKKSESLTGFSLYMWWFPTEIQEVLEMLMFRKPLDGDVGRLLSLIMFAGIDFDNDIFFETQVIQKAFLPKTEDGANNLLFESQQNLSVLLFGLNVDDVRKTFLVSFLSPVLTISLFCRALAS
jgi:hypothetical protein